MANTFPDISALKVEIPNKKSLSDKLFISYRDDSSTSEQLRTTPPYQSVQQFRRHLLSWSCISIEGFHYLDMYNRNFLPDNLSSEWLQLLLRSLFDSGHYCKLDELYKMGCSSCNIWVRSETGDLLKQYKAGKSLVNRLMGKDSVYYTFASKNQTIPEVTQLLTAFNA